MTLLFYAVLPASRMAARASRTFYDEERERVFPGIPRNDVFLAELTYEQFLSDMEDSFRLFHAAKTPPSALSRASLRVARTIENSARFTMIKAVSSEDEALESAVAFEDDDEFVVEYLEREGLSKEQRLAARARGYKRSGKAYWARVPTGRETCGWCLMLASRGPVYESQTAAGGMNQWHDGCDCKIVPVFDLGDWEGRERYLAAEEMWKRETRDRRGKDAVKAMEEAAKNGKYREYLASV